MSFNLLLLTFTRKVVIAFIRIPSNAVPEFSAKERHPLEPVVLYKLPPKLVVVKNSDFIDYTIYSHTYLAKPVQQVLIITFDQWSHRGYF